MANTGYVHLNEVGGEAFHTAISDGMSPAEAYNTSVGSMAEIGESEIPMGAWEADMEAASQIFKDVIDSGGTPEDAFVASREAGGQAAADWAAENDSGTTAPPLEEMPPEGSATEPEDGDGDGIHMEMPDFQGDAPQSTTGPGGDGGDGIHVEMPDFQGDAPQSTTGPEGDGGDGIHVSMPDFHGDAPQSATGPEGDGGDGIQVAMPELQGDLQVNSMEGFDEDEIATQPGEAQLGGDENGWGLQGDPQVNSMEGFDEDEFAPVPVGDGGAMDSLVTDGRGTVVQQGAPLEGQIQGAGDNVSGGMGMDIQEVQLEGNMAVMDEIMTNTMDQNVTNQSPDMTKMQEQPADMVADGMEPMQSEIDTDIV